MSAGFLGMVWYGYCLEFVSLCTIIIYVAFNLPVISVPANHDIALDQTCSHLVKHPKSRRVHVLLKVVRTLQLTSLRCLGRLGRRDIIVQRENIRQGPKGSDGEGVDLRV